MKHLLFLPALILAAIVLWDVRGGIKAYRNGYQPMPRKE